MDPLTRMIQALLAKGGGPQVNMPTYGTPPFVPSSTPGPYTQQQVPNTAIPVTPPANTVPQSPPVTTTANIPASTDVPKPLTLREELEAKYNRIATAPAEKQNKWLSGLYLALQGAQRIADPENRTGAYTSGAPIRSLKDARKEAQLAGIQGQLAPIYQQQKQKYESILAGAKTEKELADIAKTKAETDKIKQGSPEIRTVDGVIYERGNDGTWRTATGIPAPAKVKVKLDNGPEIEISGEKAYDAQEQRKLRKEEADRRREEIIQKEQIEQGKYGAGQHENFAAAQRAWKKERQALVTDGEELQNNAGDLERQADGLEAKGGVAEAAELRTKAAGLRSQGRAKIRQGNELPPPNKSDYPTYNVPKNAKVDKKRDPLGLLN